MRAFEIIVGLVVALVLFVVFKIIGFVIKAALIVGLLGFAAGFFLAWLFRRGKG